MPDANEKTDSSLIRQLHDRGSIRQYRPDPVPEEMITTVLNAACKAPSSCNQESYSLIVVRDIETRRKIKEACGGGQPQLEQAPVFIAFCADTRRVSHACEKYGEPFNAGYTLEMFLVSSIDTALVGMCASLAAESIGLGTVMIGAVRNDVIAISKILRLPPKIYVVFGLCVGWPVEAPPCKPRHHLDIVVHHERYDGTGMADGVTDYDSTLAAHYRSRGMPTVDHSWSQHMIDKFSESPRPDLRAELSQLGFEFR
jgi:FMN reductase (NADPH)